MWSWLAGGVLLSALIFPTAQAEVITNASQLIDHLKGLTAEELESVLQRGSSSLGPNCSFRKSSGSGHCRYRVLNHNKTLICFPEDPMGLVGVVPGKWRQDTAVYQPSMNSKDYFNALRSILSGASGAQAKALAYVRQYLLIPSNPCGIAMTDYQSSFNINDFNESNVTFYKAANSSDIHCSTTLMSNKVWSPRNCAFVSRPQYFDTKFCTKLYNILYTKGTVPINTPNGNYYVSTIAAEPITHDKINVVADSTVQNFPKELTLMLEEASVKVAFYDVADPAAMQIAEYELNDLNMSLINTDVDNFKRFFNYVKKASAYPRPLHIPLHVHKLYDKISQVVGTPIISWQTSSPTFDVGLALSPKSAILAQAENLINSVWTSYGFSVNTTIPVDVGQEPSTGTPLSGGGSSGGAYLMNTTQQPISSGAIELTYLYRNMSSCAEPIMTITSSP